MMKRLAVILLLSIGCLLQTSCEYEPKMHMDIPGMHPLKIQLLGFQGCPGADVLGERIRQAVQDADLQASIEYVDLQSLATTDPRRGWGSPTILVDGTDLYGQVKPRTVALSCRVYVEGWPTIDELSGRFLVASR